jgi:serine/threonine protein kinase
MNNDNNLIRKTFAGCLILEKIGQGGMGVVYKAHHIKLNKVVCIKILAKELEADPRNIDFFLREAEISKQLDHPNTIHVYDYGKEKDNYYIVMSYVEGKSLDKIVSEKKFLDVKEASDIMLGVFEGLAHAHSKNIIHRDIKPSNIIVTKDGVPRIIDFGLARRVVEEKQLTITGEMIGTAYFMSPEQCRGIKVDHRTDLYSAGATYFYLLTGKYPFDGKSAIDVINKHVTEPLPNLYLLRPDLPVWTVRMIEKLMRKNPDERYQSALEVVNELKRYKEKNYDNIVLSDSEFDLNELKTKHDEISKTIRLKNEDDTMLKGIEIKPLEKHDSGANGGNVAVQKHEFVEKVSDGGDGQVGKNKKFQSYTVYYLSRLVYHFFITAVALIAVYLFSSYLKIDNLWNIPKKIFLAPYSLFFLFLSFFSFYFVFRKFQIKSVMTYLLFICLVFYACYLNMLDNIRFNFLFDPLIYFIKGLKIKKNNLFILSLFLVFLSAKLNYFRKWKRNIPYVIFLCSLYLLNIFITSVNNINFYYFNKVLFIVFILTVWFVVVYLNKNLFILFYLIFLFYSFSVSKNLVVTKYLEEKYAKEMKDYEKEKERIKLSLLAQKEEIRLEVSDRIYQNIDKYSGGINIDDIIKKETEDEIEKKLQERLSKLTPPDKNKIKKEVYNRYLDGFTNRIYSEMKKSVSLILLLAWFSLNILFVFDNLVKKNYEL